MRHGLLDARHPVVLFNNAIGDHILNLPALRALCAVFPEKLVLVCGRGVRDTFFGDLPLRDVCETEIESVGRLNAEAVAKTLGHCDLLLSLNPWHSDAIDQLLQLLRPRESVGFFRQFRNALPLDFSKHSADLAFDVPRYIEPSLRLEAFADAPVFPPDCSRLAREVRAKVPTPLRVLGVHADSQSEKIWPRDQFIALLDVFLDRHRDFVAFVVGSRDLQLDAGRWGERIVPCFGLPLAASLSLIGEMDLFVGIDSCMLHAADFFRVPGVGLFGPTNPEEFGFRLAPHRHVCGNGSMASISVSNVADSLESLLVESRSCASRYV